MRASSRTGTGPRRIGCGSDSVIQVLDDWPTESAAEVAYSSSRLRAHEPSLAGSSSAHPGSGVRPRP